MLVPVLNVKPGIRNYQYFSASFCTIIQDQQDESEDHLTLDYEELRSNEGVALISIDLSKCLHLQLDPDKLINANDDLELK